jgi:beta-galactosidase
MQQMRMSDWHSVATTASVEATVELVKDLLASRDIDVFGVYDHAANARDAGLALADEAVIVFGSPKLGTLMMEDNPDVGYELPLRVLVRDDRGVTRVSYRDPQALIDAYALSDSIPTVHRLSEVLRELTKQIARSPHD